MAYTDKQISELTDPCERLYQRAHNALHGAATITASVTYIGGGSVPRTSYYRVSAMSPNVLADVVVEDNVEWRIPTDLAAAWKRARRTYDINVFKREAMQRSGGAVADVIDLWVETLTLEKNYQRYTDLKAKYLSQAVRSHP
jgi:hypothetical protein